MRIYRLCVEGYRRIESVTVLFGDATFMIGPNNAGKSSILSAISHLLSPLKRIPEVEYYSANDETTGERKTISNRIVFEAEFRNVPAEARTWRGFKGRIFNYDPGDSGETGFCLTYRKTYELGKDAVIELKSKVRSIKPQFNAVGKPQELIDAGIDPQLVRQLFDDLDKKITPTAKAKFEEIDDLWDLGLEDMWFQNPGGIPVVVLARLPRYIVIPANTASEEMTGSGVLPKTLNELFEDVRNTSSNYKEAQRLLNELAKEMDPSDSSSEFGKMLSDLNAVMASVFPDSKIHARADLSDPDKSLKPTFTVELQSNIRTPVDHQGAGMVRSAVFGVLRFRQKWLSIREDHDIKRSIIIGFEEPEMYLHPSAANQMRDTIYELSNKDSQIVATTHSPFLIDLSRKPRQVLNRFSFVGGSIKIQSFNVTEVFKSLQEEDKDYVKMLLKIDDYVARVFFAKHVVIVEGDTEEVVIRETLRCLTPEKRLEVLANTEIIKARGKASIIGLVKYLKTMGIIPTVIHDRDAGVKGADVFNGPIKAAVGEDNVILLCECIEDVLGYDRPNREKPYAGYSKTKEWMNRWEKVPAQWRSIIEKVFKIK